MNLQPVFKYGKGYRPIVACIKCGQFKPISHADLDGEPFKAYYCEPCAQDVLAETNKAQTNKE